MLRAIERATRQTIEPMNLPSVDAVNQQRVGKFKARVSESIEKGSGAPYKALLEQFERELEVPLIDIAAALVSLAQGDTPLLLPSRDEPGVAMPAAASPHAERPNRGKPPRVRAGRPDADAVPEDFGEAARPKRPPGAASMETYRIEVGHVHSVKPGNIVGAIANESGIDGVYIGRVDIREDHSYVDLPEGMPKNIFKDLQQVRIGGRELRISRVTEKPPKPRRDPAGRHGKLKIRT